MLTPWSWVISWEAASCSAIQKFCNVFWNQKFHYHVHKSPPLVPILRQISPVHTTPSYLRSILILLSHLYLGLPSGLFPSVFPTKTSCTLLFPPMRGACPVHLIFIDLIIFSDILENMTNKEMFLSVEKRDLCPYLCKRFISVHLICVETFMPIMKEYKVLLVGVIFLNDIHMSSSFSFMIHL
jgi:hypothetical protein